MIPLAHAHRESLSPDLAEKLARLRAHVGSLESVLLAFSGGVDSTLLAKVLREELGDSAVAVTASSVIHPQFESENAASLAAAIGIRHLIIKTDELSDEAFRANPPDRCYHCKRRLFGRLLTMAREMRLRHVADGANADDSGDFRPGLQAAAELDIYSPLREVGLAKEDIRSVSRALGLPTWDRPSDACLASRFPYGEPVTPAGISQVAHAEAFLHGLGMRQVRVRHHGNTARIEVPPECISSLAGADARKQIVARLKELGYAYVALDLQGYRTGSMNEVLDGRRRDRSQTDNRRHE